MSPAFLRSLAQDVTSANPVKRAHAMATLLASLNSENAGQIIGAMHAAGADDMQMGSLVYAWAAHDGTAAMAFADEVDMSDEDRYGYKNQVVKGWASTDPDKAKAWVDGLENQKEAGGYRWNLVAGMADGSLEVATAYAIERAEAEARGAFKYMDMITERMLDKSSVGDSVKWAETLPEGNVRTAALHRIATDFAGENPEAAAAWAGAMTENEGGTKVVYEVADEWAERDPAAAVAWLETLPDGDAKSYGMAAALTEWVKRGDPVAASEYLAGMPASEQRDQAVGGFVGTLSSSDPASAATWAGTIQNEGIRQKAQITAGRSWIRNDPVAAHEWLQGSNLGEQVLENITAPRGNDKEWDGKR